MSSRLFIGFLCAALLMVSAAPAYAFDVPEYKFDGPKNDELYDPSGIISADSGVQIILPDDTYNEILPYGVTLIGPSYAGSGGGVQYGGSSDGLVIGADGYPDVWGGETGYYTPTAVYPPSVPASDVTADMLRQTDGSFGSLSIPGIKMSARLFENDMSKGVGHIRGTAYWNGNVCVMGHNRGTNNYFAKLGNLSIGDTITFTTNQGTRSYSVTFSGAISETDWTMLQPTAGNKITLISCIAGSPSLRQCVQAAEIR